MSLVKQKDKACDVLKVEAFVADEMLKLWRCSSRNWDFYIKDSNEYRRSNWEGF